MIKFEIREIPGHPGYYATTDGRIIGKRGKELVGHIDRCGYHEVLLSENGKTTNYLAHRLIAKTFIDNPNNFGYINHKDGHKLNNSIENLEWCTKSQNTQHSFRNRLQANVTNQYGTFCVLTKEQDDLIASLHNQGYIDREIASMVGCSRELVGRKIRRMGLR